MPYWGTYLNAAVASDEMEAPADGRCSRVVTLEHESIDFFADVLVAEKLAIARRVDEQIEESQSRFLYQNRNWNLVVGCWS